MKHKPLNPRLPAPYNKMSVAELDAEVEKFDHPMAGVPGRPLTAAQRRQDRRARRKMGRPTIGKGAKRVTITMEQSLLGQVDSYARKNKLTRSATIASGVITLLKAG
jgi:hypothetical protein